MEQVKQVLDLQKQLRKRTRVNRNKKKTENKEVSDANTFHLSRSEDSRAIKGLKKVSSSNLEVQRKGFKLRK